MCFSVNSKRLKDLTALSSLEKKKTGGRGEKYITKFNCTFHNFLWGKQILLQQTSDSWDWVPKYLNKDHNGIPLDTKQKIQIISDNRVLGRNFNHELWGKQTQTLVLV